MTKKKQTNTPVKTRRLSITRIILAIFLLGGISYSSLVGWNQWEEHKSLAEIEPWFGAYVDATALPQYPFEQLGKTDTPNTILSFIVSDESNVCNPSWGNYYSLDEAGEVLDFDRRIALLRQQEGQIAISFGGALNHELAVACSDADQLYTAYKQVIERYQIDTIDLDIEGEDLGNREANQRRALALSRLQKDQREAGKNLAIWLTLPVTTHGLTEDGTNIVADTLAGGVDLAGVNPLTMNYGESKSEEQNMADASIRALIETHRQLGILYKQQNISLSSGSLWRKIGATPMIGQNDIVSEVFTLDDAIQLNEFANQRGVGRMSMWSANRDVPCGGNYIDTQKVSDSCSGVSNQEFEFATTLSLGFPGKLSDNSSLVTSEVEQEQKEIVDDPETSPYQIWKKVGAYLEGTKVVWKGNVYQAKWWTKGDIPDNPVLQSWESPWQLLGPVLPGETPIALPTLPVGTYPTWTGGATYNTGDRVIFEEVPYEAKWWNQGESPAVASENPDSSPWVPLTLDEIKTLLEETE